MNIQNFSINSCLPASVLVHHLQYNIAESRQSIDVGGLYNNVEMFLTSSGSAHNIISSSISILYVIPDQPHGYKISINLRI